MSINWKKKLSSRKFWCAVCGAVVPYLLAFGHTEAEIAQITGIIMGTGALVTYILVEGNVDASYVEMDNE